MALHGVRVYGDPVLRQKAVEVTEFDATLAELVRDMHETMAAYRLLDSVGWWRMG